MPKRPPKTCAYPGCYKPTHRRFCETHEREHNRAFDQGRPTPGKRGYDYAWQKLAKRKKRANPVCEVEGCNKPTEEVDHIDGNQWNRAWSNLRSLCKTHHSAKTARENSFNRRR